MGLYQSELEMNWIIQFIVWIRLIRGEMKLSAAKLLPVLFQNASDDDRNLVVQHKTLLVKIGRAESVRLLTVDEEPPPSATALLGNMRVLVPLAGIIDIEAERARLAKKQVTLKIDLDKSHSKLDNPNFVNNAPKTVVTKETERMTNLKDQISKLEEQLEKLENLS